MHFFSSATTHQQGVNINIRQPLTKTAIRRMRLADLQVHLQSLGVTDIMGKRRPELQTKLLDAIGGSAQERLGKTKKKQANKIQIDPSRLYVLQVAGWRPAQSDPQYLEDGVGIGISLYHVNDDMVDDPDSFLQDSSAEIVWRGAQYFPSPGQPRTTFEAEYAAILWALEYVSVRWGLERIILQSSNDVVIRMLRGIYNVNKPNLIKLTSKFQEIQRDRFSAPKAGGGNRLLQIYSISSKDNLQTQKLAKDAVSSRKPENINLEKGLQLPQDPFSYLEEEVIDEIADETPSQTSPKLPLDSADSFVSAEFETSQDSTSIDHEARIPDAPSLIDPSKTYKLQFDGGSRGNPGPGGSGMIIYDAQTGEEIFCGWFYHKKKVTNNVAEYDALLQGLKRAKELGIQRLLVEGDSNLAIQQSLGEWKVKNAGLKKYSAQVRALLDEFQEVDLKHIPRKENSKADYLANLAMDTKSSGSESKTTL